MKARYMTHLPDEDIVELAKICIGDAFRKVKKIDKGEEGFAITVEVLLEDKESEEGYVIQDKTYTLEDFSGLWF